MAAMSVAANVTDAFQAMGEPAHSAFSAEKVTDPASTPGYSFFCCFCQDFILGEPTDLIACVIDDAPFTERVLLKFLATIAPRLFESGEHAKATVAILGPATNAAKEEHPCPLNSCPPALDIWTILCKFAHPCSLY
jgi:hypothetical protein